MKTRDFVIHLDIAVLIIGLFGLMGVCMGENGPHPRAMVYVCIGYFCAKIAWHIMEAILIFFNNERRTL